MVARETRALTRAQRFQYFVREVLDKDEDDPLVSCLVYNGIQSIPDILALSDRTMERMKYMEDESTEKQEIRAGDIGILKAFQVTDLGGFSSRNDNFRRFYANWYFTYLYTPTCVPTIYGSSSHPFSTRIRVKWNL